MTKTKIDGEFYRLFKGKRYALVNTVTTLPRAKKIEEILKKQGDEVKIISSGRGNAIYRRNKKFR
jgi:hypothetical protein